MAAFTIAAQPHWQSQLRTGCLRTSSPALGRGNSFTPAAVAAGLSVACLGRRRQGRSKKSIASAEKGAKSDAVPAELGEWCAFVINLARRGDRREKLWKLLSKANKPLLARLEILEAVDRKDLTLDDEVVEDAIKSHALARSRRAESEEHYTIVHDGDGNLVHFDDHLTLGGIACALSHRLALQRLASHPTAEWGLIIEDDVNAVVPRVDLAIAKLLQSLPDDWSAVCLGYHDDLGARHPLALETLPMDPSFDGAEVDLIRWHRHIFGLGAWMVRKTAAQDLVAHAFPIGSQVDCALTSWLSRNGRELWKVDPTKLLFYAPSSEEEMDSDVQTMVPLQDVVKKHESLQGYLDHLSGRSAFDYRAYEEQWRKEWEASHYEEYYGRSREEDSQETEAAIGEIPIKDEIDDVNVPAQIDAERSQ